MYCKLLTVISVLFVACLGCAREDEEGTQLTVPVPDGAVLLSVCVKDKEVFVQKFSLKDTSQDDVAVLISGMFVEAGYSPDQEHQQRDIDFQKKYQTLETTDNANWRRVSYGKGLIFYKDNITVVVSISPYFDWRENRHAEVPAPADIVERVDTTQMIFIGQK